jgi:large repetitive protein
VATVNVLGPFQVLSRPLTLQPRESKPPPPGLPLRGPVASWRLDEADGTEVADATEHRHTARVLGRPRWAPGQGKAGGALEFDGATTYVDCGDAEDFDFRGALTVSLWLKPGGPGKSPQTLVAKGGDAWRIRSEGGEASLVFSLEGPQTTGKDRNKSPQASSKRSVNDGQWHHLAGVYDGQRIALYVDGKLEDSVAAAGSVALNTEPVWLGNDSAARGEYFRGWLDDVRLYDRGLTEAEIQALQRITPN